MKIAISGASGFIGTNLSDYFKKNGNIIVPINRFLLDDESAEKLKEALSDVDVVINLAGTSINHRWTESYKKKIYDSRIFTTRRIVETINSLERKPQIFISVSAVGYYPSEGCYDEYSSTKGDSFLSDICYRWEQEARQVSASVRLAITRFGVVIAEKGGAFKQMTLPMKFKVATVVGPGSQSFAWIYIDDLVMAMKHIIETPSINDIINFVTPEHVTNKEFTETIAKHRKCFIRLTIPQFFLRMILGKASSVITEGQCVIPHKLLDSGYKFIAPTVEKLADILYNKHG